MNTLKTDIFSTRPLSPKEMVFAAKVILTAFEIEYDVEQFDTLYNKMIAISNKAIRNGMDAEFDDLVKEFETMKTEEDEMVIAAIDEVKVFVDMFNKDTSTDTTTEESTTTEEN